MAKKAKPQIELIRRDQLADALKMVERNLTRILDDVGIRPAAYEEVRGYALYNIDHVAHALNAKPEWIRSILAGDDVSLDLHQAAKLLGVTSGKFNLIFATTGAPRAAASWKKFGKVWSRKQIESCEAVFIPPTSWSVNRNPNRIRERAEA